MFSTEDRQFMTQAVRLAERGVNSTDPNPRVGCVLVREGVVVGEGFHEKAGEPHAEVFALRDAGDEALDATAYVTLEPCSHHGRTPPCADALVESGVKRVVVAMQDPNPLVAGQGVQRLREAGIDVAVGLLEEQARALNPGFVKRMTQGLPFVRVKLAMSLDGRTAMADGESVWISSPESRTDVQRLRARSSAVLSGVGTVLFDDPSLNVRLNGARPEVLRQPWRVIVDSELRTPVNAKTLSLPGKVLVVHASEDGQRMSALEAAGAELLFCGSKDGRVDLLAMMKQLADKGVNEIHVEAGATLCGALLDRHLVDECVFYMAPHLMGDGGRGLFHLPRVQNMSQRMSLKINDIRAVGEDWRITAMPSCKE